MCEPTTIAYAVTAAAALYTGYQSYEQGKQRRAVEKYNQRNLENQAQKERAKGTKEELKQRRLTAELISEQRAQTGAGGITVDTGSAGLINEDTARLGEADALTIRENTGNVAGAIQQQAQLAKYRGDAAYQEGKSQLYGSAVKAGGSVAAGAFSLLDSSWYSGNSRLTTNASGESASASVGNIA